MAMLVVAILSSCKKSLLNKLPNDRLSSEIFWKTENDARLAANALYTDLDGQNIFSWDALTEIAHTNQLANTQTFIELSQDFCRQSGVPAQPAHRARSA